MSTGMGARLKRARGVGNPTAVPHPYKRRSFLKEWGWSRPASVLVCLLCELPCPGWVRRSRRRGQGSGGARPRCGRRALTTAPFGACCSGQEDRKGLSGFLLGLARVVFGVFSAGFPVAGRRWGCQSFLRRVCGMKRFAGMVGRDQSAGATSPVSGVMTCTIRSRPSLAAHAARGGWCRARMW